MHCRVEENSAPNTVVAGANCTGFIPWSDPDLIFGDFVTWSISRNDERASFQIDEATGELSVSSTAQLDFETQVKKMFASN